MDPLGREYRDLSLYQRLPARPGSQTRQRASSFARLSAEGLTFSIRYRKTASCAGIDASMKRRLQSQLKRQLLYSSAVARISLTPLGQRQLVQGEAPPSDRQAPLDRVFARLLDQLGQSRVWFGSPPDSTPSSYAHNVRNGSKITVRSEKALWLCYPDATKYSRSTFRFHSCASARR